jgi:deazaflavin-dependent oxidoreductase (nitroreductase family)
MVGRILAEPDGGPVAEGSYGLRVLQTVGRRSGRPRRTPIAVVRDRGADYVVSPQLSRDWVSNLRAHPVAELLGPGQAEVVRAVAVPDDEGARVVTTYLAAMTVPWARQAFPVGVDAGPEQVRAHMTSMAVFRLEAVSSKETGPSR